MFVIDDEIQRISNGLVSLQVPKMSTSGPEWNLSKTPFDVQLAVGESVLSDTVCISPEGKLFSKPSMLKMPFNIYEVPEFTEIVFEFLDLTTRQWRRMVAVFTVDENGIRYAAANVHIATKYTVCLRLKSYCCTIPATGATVSPFGNQYGMQINFVSGTFKEDTNCTIKANKFTATAEEQLKELGYIVSTILHVEMQDGDKPLKSIEIRLPIKSAPDAPGNLRIMHLSQGELTDITKEAQPMKENNFVAFHVNHFSQIFAIVTNFVIVTNRALMNILKYVQGTISARFYLYRRDNPDRKFCVACSRVEDRESVDEELKHTGYGVIEETMSNDGIHESTHMTVDIKGPLCVWSVDPLKLRWGKSNFCITEKFYMTRGVNNDEDCDDEKHVVIVRGENDDVVYGALSFTVPLVRELDTLIESPEPFRFLGLKLNNCYLDDVCLENVTERIKLEQLGLDREKEQNIKKRVETAGSITAMKFALKEISAAFIQGTLCEKWLETFQNVGPEHTRERIREVIRFLTSPREDSDEKQRIFLTKICESYCFKQYDIVALFGKLLGLAETAIKDAKIEATTVHEQCQDVTSKESRCCRLILNLALNEGGDMLKIIKALLETKHWFQMFKLETKKDVMLQILLDKLGELIENQLFD